MKDLHAAISAAVAKAHPTGARAGIALSQSLAALGEVSEERNDQFAPRAW